MLRASLAAVAALSIAGCASLDPTEEEGVLNLRNKLPVPVSVGYCDSAACDSAAWTDLIQPGASSKDSINAAKGTSGWFIIKSGSRVLGCQRLSFPDGPHRLSLVVAQRALRRCSGR